MLINSVFCACAAVHLSIFAQQVKAAGQETAIGFLGSRCHPKWALSDIP